MLILGVSLMLPETLSVAVMRSLCVTFCSSLSKEYERLRLKLALVFIDQGTLGLV